MLLKLAGRFWRGAYWGGRYNRAVKDLMMAHAFTFAKHVLFFINENNLRSQMAVEKIGGQRVDVIDGVKLTPRLNSTVIYRVSKGN